MHGMKLATLLAFATSSVMASHIVKVNFRRFSHEGCSETFHIAKDTHLEDPHCKTFDHDEPPFMSFTSNIENGDVIKHACHVTVFDQPNCKGTGFTMADLQNSSADCGNTGGVTGRSALVHCAKRVDPQNIVTSTPSHTPTVIQKPVSTSTVTVKRTSSTLSTTTVTLVPQPSSPCQEVCDSQ